MINKAITIIELFLNMGIWLHQSMTSNPLNPLHRHLFHHNLGMGGKIKMQNDIVALSTALNVNTMKNTH